MFYRDHNLGVEKINRLVGANAVTVTSSNCAGEYLDNPFYIRNFTLMIIGPAPSSAHICQALAACRPESLITPAPCAENKYLIWVLFTVHFTPVGRIYNYNQPAQSIRFNTHKIKSQFRKLIASINSPRTRAHAHVCVCVRAREPRPMRNWLDMRGASRPLGAHQTGRSKRIAVL